MTFDECLIAMLMVQLASDVNAEGHEASATIEVAPISGGACVVATCAACGALWRVLPTVAGGVPRFEYPEIAGCPAADRAE